MFGQRLRMLRKMKNLNQQDLADYLQVAKSTISSYENNVNEPSNEILRKVASYFDVSIDYLLGHSEQTERVEGGPGVFNESQLEKIDELYEILYSIEDTEARDKIIEAAVLYANGVKQQKKR